MIIVGGRYDNLIKHIESTSRPDDALQAQSSLLALHQQHTSNSTSATSFSSTGTATVTKVCTDILACLFSLAEHLRGGIDSLNREAGLPGAQEAADCSRGTHYVAFDSQCQTVDIFVCSSKEAMNECQVLVAQLWNAGLSAEMSENILLPISQQCALAAKSGMSIGSSFFLILRLKICRYHR